MTEPTGSCRINIDRSEYSFSLERSVRKGNFVLASGKSSDLYVDARLTTMSPGGNAADRTAFGLDMIVEPRLEAGLRSAGLPWAQILCLSQSVTPVQFSRRLLRAFTVRKEAKTHGTGNLIEGPFQKGDQRCRSSRMS